MISVKFNLDKFGAVEASAPTITELKNALDAIGNFIAPTVITNAAEPNPIVINKMFTNGELTEAEAIAPTIDTIVTADQIFSNTAPLPTPAAPPALVPFTTAVAGGELDIDGRPWNPDIHTRTKSKGKDGRWKIKRNLDTEPPVFTAPLPTPPAVNFAPPMPALAPVAPSPTPPAAPLAEDFNDLMIRIVGLETQGKITRKQIDQTLKNVGLNSVIDLANRLDLLAAVSDEITNLAGQK